MTARIRASIPAIAFASMLAACASKGPPSSTGISLAGAQNETSSEYQNLVDNAGKQVICRHQVVTGSRIGSMVCLTRAEMKAQRERALEVMRDIRSNAAITRPIPDVPTARPPSTSPGSP
jgi:hypothetical protein